LNYRRRLKKPAIYDALDLAGGVGVDFLVSLHPGFPRVLNRMYCVSGFFLLVGFELRLVVAVSLLLPCTFFCRAK